jgi:hypothetical protein
MAMFAKQGLRHPRPSGTDRVLERKRLARRDIVEYVFQAIDLFGVLVAEDLDCFFFQTARLCHLNTADGFWTED